MNRSKAHERKVDCLDLFLLPAGAWNDGHREQAGVERLSNEERARLGRYRFPKHRSEFLRGKLLTRGVLSTYVDEVSHALRFTTGAEGKPGLQGSHSVSFNLSNSHGSNLLGIASQGELGIDIEQIDTQRRHLDVADRYFNPGECQYLMRAPPEEVAFRFFSLWTLKEALLKAHGGGLAVGLDRFAVVLACGTLRFGFSPDLAVELAELGQYWQAGLLRIPGDALAAWFLLTDDPNPFAIRAYACSLTREGDITTAPLACPIIAVGSGAVAPQLRQKRAPMQRAYAFA
jgi:phosphopantetheinyl transferase